MTVRPLRVAMAAAQAGPVSRSMRRAILAAGAELAVALDPADPRSFGERAQALRDAHPDVALFGAADGADADRLALVAEALRFGCAAQRPAPHALVVTGDAGAVSRMRPLLAEFEVVILPDVRANEGRRALAVHLRAMRRDVAAAERDDALEALAFAAAEAHAAAVLVVDVSGASTSIVRAQPGAALIAVHARPLGIGSAADRVVARAGLDRVRRWIPWAVDQPTLLERVFNRARWPGVLSSAAEARAVEIALAHEAIAHALADATAAGIGPALCTVGHVIVSGGLAELPPPISLLVVADTLDLAERVAVHRASGADGTTLRPLGVIAPASDGRGSLSLARDQDAGEVGILVDGRPRPLVIPVRDAERVPAVARWYEAVGVPVEATA
ncbi:MAG: glutamate mutase L [Chloroflexi bacterium]|nr:glutamate mutase L [Chloroflexota bacterium]